MDQTDPFIKLMRYKNVFSLLYVTVDFLWYINITMKTREQQLKEVATDVKFLHLDQDFNFNKIRESSDLVAYDSLVYVRAILDHQYSTIK